MDTISTISYRDQFRPSENAELSAIQGDRRSAEPYDMSNQIVKWRAVTVDWSILFSF